jgi:D-alanyl-lipoteichoic acid acyltransferase DltB (MBOAT superfamily)
MDFKLGHLVFAIGLPHGSEWIFILLFFLLGPVFWISALISCMRNESSTGNTKVIWVVIILLVQFLGPLAYLLIRRPQRIRELGC